MFRAVRVTPEWLIAQRWFRSKQRPVAGISELDRAPIGTGDAALSVLAVSYADGGEDDQYLVPAVGDREPRDGEGVWAALITAIADGAELRGTRGRFRCSRTDALGDLHGGADLAERSLRVEQSNTSVVLGETLILKLYRLLEPGLNPDIEVSRFLTDAGFGDTPPVAGAIRYETGDVVCSAAMLQEFVPSSGDAWASVREALSDSPDAALALVARIGELTARMHAALASHPNDPAFPSRPATTAETAGWRASAEQQLSQAVTAVVGEAQKRLVVLAPAITAQFADTFGSATGGARVTRIHGDYHLGQLLARADGGFSVVDFEGEPARLLAQRRQPSSPLRDIAGMLRSLDYAARTVGQGGGFDSDVWLHDARGAFLKAYGGVKADQAGLLAAFELEKACYEVRYEANNRPDWLWLPLAAVERLAAA